MDKPGGGAAALEANGPSNGYGWAIAAAAGDLLGARLAAGALGFLTVFLGIGQVTGPFVAGRIAQSTGSFAGAFVLAGVLALAGALFSLLLRVERRRS